MDLTESDIELISSILRYYHKPEFRGITDYRTAVLNRKEISEGIWEYKCPCQTIYLNNEHYAVEYGRQHTNGGYYSYDFNTYENNNEEELPYTYDILTKLEWKRTKPGGIG